MFQFITSALCVFTLAQVLHSEMWEKANSNGKQFPLPLLLLMFCNNCQTLLQHFFSYPRRPGEPCLIKGLVLYKRDSLFFFSFSLELRSSSHLQRAVYMGQLWTNLHNLYVVKAKSVVVLTPQSTCNLCVP